MKAESAVSNWQIALRQPRSSCISTKSNSARVGPCSDSVGPDAAAGAVPSPLHPKTRKDRRALGAPRSLRQASRLGFGMAGRVGMQFALRHLLLLPKDALRTSR